MKDLSIKNIIKKKIMLEGNWYKIRKINNLIFFLEEKSFVIIQKINKYDFTINKKNYLENIELNEKKNNKIIKRENYCKILNKLRLSSYNELCEIIQKQSKKYTSIKNNIFYKALYHYLFLLLFIISFLIIKVDSSNNVYSESLILLSSNIIRLTVNQSGPQKIFNSHNSYILDVKINNISNNNYSEIGTYYFENDYNIVELNLNLNIKNLSNFFYSCSKITEIDFTNFYFSNIELIDGLFNGCTSLTSIEFGNNNIENIEDMSSMFNNCKSLGTLNLFNFNTLNVINMQWMFHNCYSLVYLDLSNFNTTSVINMEGMFSGDIKLSSLIIDNFNTANVTNMEKMFENCKSLEKLNLTSFTINDSNNMSYMFNGCSKLNYIRFNSLESNGHSLCMNNMLDKTSDELTINANCNLISFIF